MVPSNYKGIAIDWDAEDAGQASFKRFVDDTLDVVYKLQGAGVFAARGQEFINEFKSTDGLHSSHSDTDGQYSLLIRPPKKTFQGVKIDVAETKMFIGQDDVPYSKRVIEGKMAQVIECWWPGSQNSNLAMGIKVKPQLQPAKWKKEYGQKKVVLEGSVPRNKILLDHRPEGDDKEYQLAEGQFFYAGQLHTFQIALIHEMIHAWHGISGTSLVSIASKDTKSEERQVVGLPPYTDRKYTENIFRFLLKIPLREDYVSLDIKLSDKEKIQFTDMHQGWCQRQ